jgi:hypothetical protein
MKIGIIGPSRRNNGTGPFVTNFLLEEGAKITAICASTEDSASRAGVELKPACGYQISAFSKVEQMIGECDLDAVAICSPVAFHEAQLQYAVENGLHVFCEKPLIWAGGLGLADRVANLAGMFEDRNLVIHQNTQWTYVLDDIRALMDTSRIASFEMLMSPPAPGLVMFWEAVPHPVSVIIALGGSGLVGDISSRFTEDLSSLVIEFVAFRCDMDPLRTRIILRSKADQPRPCYMKLNGIQVDREVFSLVPYQLGLRIKDCISPMQDPVQRSVQHFLRRCETADVKGKNDCIVRQFQVLEALWPFVLKASGNGKSPH